MRRRQLQSPPPENVFSAAVECAQLGVWDANLVANTCYYSPSWKQMLGYEDGELTNHPDLWLDFIHPDDREQALESGNSHIDGHAVAVESEFRLRHRDGRWIWVLDRGRVIERDAMGRPTRMIGVQTDITAQKEAASALALLNQRIELALDTGGIGLWSFELDTERTVWDGRMREIFGLGAGPEDVPRQTWHSCLHPEDAAAAELATERLLTHGEPVSMTYRILRPDGMMRHVFALSRIVRFEDAPALLVGSICDVTAQMESAEALAAEKERLRVILGSIGDAVIAADPAGEITFANPAAERLLGDDQSTLIGRLVPDVLPLRHEQSGAPLRCASEEALRLRHMIERDEPAVFRNKLGEQRCVRDLASPVFSSAGEVVGTVLVVQDTTRERVRQRELAHLARHDGLTDLLNRTAFDAALSNVLVETDGAAAHALLYIDLDRFKLVNDTVGHAAGDLLLKLVAKAMVAALPGDALVARLGGDEFAALVKVNGPDDAYQAGCDLVRAIGAQRLSYGDQSHAVGASVGMVLLGASTPDALTALSLADAACYLSKSRGRNKVSIHDPASRQHHDAFAEVRAASELLQALKESRIVLYGQEIRALSSAGGSGPVERIEVLARLIGSDGTLIMPKAFIPAAERFDLMGVLDRRVIRLALDALLAASLEPRDQPLVAVNLSAMSISDPELWSFVEAQLRETGIAAGRLCFEITETVAVNNFTAAERFVRSARKAGCKISLDDFGSGLSSFSYLRSFPVDCIKIDGDFVRDIAGSAFDQAICSAIGTIAAKLGMEVVAECIEGPDAIDVLKAQGIGFGQGYWLHRPEPLVHLLGRNSQKRLMSLS